jgi:hypothetical protein
MFEPFSDAVTTPARYRIDVFSSTVEDVVASAGGWLFDRAMSGWEVNVLAGMPSDARSLQILGINAVAPAPTVQSLSKAHRTQALAVAADVFNTDAHVREIVLAAVERDLAEVTIWGESQPVELRRRTDDLRYRLSSAARAFKTQALAAAALPLCSASTTERFMRVQSTGGPISR